MATQNSLETNLLSAPAIHRIVTIASSLFSTNPAACPSLFKLRYKGEEVSATRTLASGVLTLKHGAAGSEVADETVGVAGVVDPAVYTTAEAYMAAVNQSDNWQMIMKDGLPSFLMVATTLLNEAEGVGNLFTVDGEHVRIDIDGCNDFVSGETRHIIPICIGKEGDNPFNEEFDSITSHPGPKGIYGMLNRLEDYIRTMTVAAGTAVTDAWKLVAVDRNNVERDIIPETEAAATTVEYSMKETFAYPLDSRAGERLVLLQYAQAKPSAGVLQAHGRAIKRDLHFLPID